MIVFANKVLSLAGPPPAGIHREIFPRQARIAPDALGSLIKLPLGIHRLTQRRCLFIDAQGQPYGDQIGLLKNIKTVSQNQFLRAMQSLKAQQSPQSLDKKNIDLTPVNQVIQGCKVIQYLKDKAEKTQWLNHTERLTLLAVLGHLGKAGEYMLHQIIGHTSNYDFRITQKWLGRVQTFPISCPKIKEWHSHITPALGCVCDFPVKKGSYPSPVLYADPEYIVRLKKKTKKKRQKETPPAETQAPSAAPEPSTTYSTQVESNTPDIGSQPGEIGEIFQEYLQSRKRLRELNQKIADLEKQMHRLCEQQQTDQLETEWGTLKRIKIGDQYRWIIEI